MLILEDSYLEDRLMAESSVSDAENEKDLKDEDEDEIIEELMGVDMKILDKTIILGSIKPIVIKNKNIEEKINIKE